MHLVLEGEFKRKIKILFSLLGEQDAKEANKILQSVTYPHDFHKKARMLEEKHLRKAKAGELQTHRSASLKWAVGHRLVLSPWTSRVGSTNVKC